jgi:hypothetical protein
MRLSRTVSGTLQSKSPIQSLRPVQIFDRTDRQRIEEKLSPPIRMQFVPVFDRISQNSKTVLYPNAKVSPDPQKADWHPVTLPRSN